MLKIKEIRKSKKMTQKELSDYLGVTQATLSGWENEKFEIDNKSLIKCSKLFGVSVDYLLGNENQSNAIFLDEKKLHMVPLFESVSAGFGTKAKEMIIDYVPCYITNELEFDEYICIKVSGDSMFPKIENGDIIQVHKQSSVDSDSIAVVLLDNDEGLVKKVVYGDDWIELQSINPMYQPMRFEGKDVTRISVVGLVKKIIKDI